MGFKIIFWKFLRIMGLIFKPNSTAQVRLRKLSIFITFLICSLQAFSQEIESVNREKVNRLNAESKKNLTKPDSLFYYSNLALQLAKDIGYKKGEASALKFLGIHAHLKGDFNQAINTYKSSLAYFETMDDDLEVGKLNLNLATTYNAKLDYVNSTSYALEALKSFKKVNDINGEGRVLNLLGVASYVQKNYREALGYFKQYQTLAFKTNDPKEIGSSFNNIGSTYERLAILDSAIFCYQKAIVYKSKHASKTDIGTIYQNIGALYHTKRHEKQALYYHLKSKGAYEAEGSKKWMSHSYYNLGLTYKMLGDTAESKLWLNKAVTLAKNIGEKEILAESYKVLSELSINSGSAEQDYKQAYSDLQKSINQRDSILSKDKISIIEDLKTRYQTEKKEERIKDLNLQAKIKDLEISKKNSLLWFVFFLLALLLLSIWLYVNRRKIKNKITLQTEIIRQQDLATKAVLDAEERERRRIASDLHDGVGQILSAALMNLNGHIEHNENTENNSRLEKCLALVNESYDEMRTISHQMMPNALIKSGLTAAIREFLNKIDENQVKITLDISGFKNKLDDQLETVLYRVIQESVNNVIKHAKASKLSIQLHKDEEGITIAIEDNGVGFSQTTNKEGIGLSNIKSRITFIKGSVEYDSAPGKGTLVNIFIPV